MSAPSEPPLLPAWRAAAFAWVALGALILLNEVLLVPSLVRLLATAGLVVGPYERVATSLVSLGVLVGPLLLGWVLLLFGTPRSVALLLAGVTTFVALGDAYLYRNFGRHVSDLLVYARLPAGVEAAGDPLYWLPRLGAWALWAGSYVALCAVGARLLERARPSLFLARSLSLLGGGSLAALAALPWFLPASLPERIRPRLVGALWLPLEGARIGDAAVPPRFAALHQALEREYALRYAYLFGPPDDARTLAVAPPRERSLPNVSLVIAESFRADVLSRERMPRLTAWAERGMLFEQHLSGANHSETGLFTLLYGRSALTYHSTLNVHARPSLCEALRSLGYLCGYFSGHPQVWVRREEFLNPRTMDVFSHDDRGTWNDWDEGALARAEAFLAGGSPRLAITFLMSSHYEYRYPPEYARHLPDTAPRVAWASMESTPDEFATNANRYHNVVEYVDALVGGHLERLGSQDVVSVFTGDHGEMLGEDGHFGHGYGFADAYVHVPLVVRGPGVPERVVRERTVHQDLLPSLLELLEQPPTSGVGRSWFGQPARSSLLLAHTKQDFRTVEALLLLDDQRLALRFDLERPLLEVREFQDALGRPIEPGAIDVERWRKALSEELDRAGRRLP